MKFKMGLFKEGTLWVAVCLDYYIAAQGRTKKEARDALEDIVVATLVINKGNLDDVPPTPASTLEKVTETYTAESNSLEVREVRYDDDGTI